MLKYMGLCFPLVVPRNISLEEKGIREEMRCQKIGAGISKES